MTIDAQGRRLLRHITPIQRAAFLSAFLTGYLTHLYAFTNLIPNSDGLSRVYDTQQMTISGRWFLHYASSLNDFTQMPAVIGLLSILFLSLAAALTVDLLVFRSRTLAMIAGAVMAAFPCLGYTFLYMFTASAYCLAIFLAVLSVWLAKRSQVGWLLGVIAMALAMGTYQAYAAVAISLSLLVVLRQTLDRRATFSGTLHLGLRLVTFLVAGAVLYYVVLLIFLRVKNLELLSYLGMDQASSGYPFSRLPSLLLDTYKQAIAFFFLPGSANGFASLFLVVVDLAMGSFEDFAVGEEGFGLSQTLINAALTSLVFGIAGSVVMSFTKLPDFLDIFKSIFHLAGDVLIRHFAPRQKAYANPTLTEVPHEKDHRSQA